MSHQTSSVQRLAAAKVNLALHVTGQRADGYHLLDTLVAFADFGDLIELSLSDVPRATLSGPFSAGLSMDEGNLICRAEALWRAAAGMPFPPVHLHLTKNLPIASGIGGGSADAAATLLGLEDLFDHHVPEAQLHAIALELGADVPMCLASQPLRATGIGDTFETVSMDSQAIVLINPGVEVSTPAVFSNLQSKTNAPLTDLPSDKTGRSWIIWLQDQRNDLQKPALANVPEIGHCLDALAGQTGCLLARMSGSGATCFGLFENDDQAQQAVQSISASHSGWWVQAGRTI